MTFEYAAVILEMIIKHTNSCQYHVDAKRFKGIKHLFYPKCLAMLHYIACRDIDSAAKLH